MLRVRLPTIISTRLKNNGQCFAVLVNNAKRLVSQDRNLPNASSHRLLSENSGGRKIQTKSFSQSRASKCFQASRDLKRFLEEVGTDPKEASYWLRHFQDIEMKTENPFAVVQIDSSIFNNQTVLERLASSLAFLYRNGMEVVVVHGVAGSSYGILDKKTKHQLIEENVQLVDLLIRNDVAARPSLCSSHMISVRTAANHLTDLGIDDVNIKYIKWCLSGSHIPVIAAVGETEDGQVVYTDTTSTTVEIASLLKPTKVIFLNSTGGLKDTKGKTIDCVSLPQDVSGILEQPWMDEASLHVIESIASFIPRMPQHTSAVITSADSLIKELFTHCGCGTLFQSAEKINVYHSLESIDIGKLKQLLLRSFKQSLDNNYFSSLEKNLHSLYITESYSAAAIIVTPEETCGIPYLDKFSINKQSQGLGTSKLLWEKITQDFPQLCWRSRVTNRINPWYFVRSGGSCHNGNWIVFWYGVSDPHTTHQITQYTSSLPSSFDPVAPHDEQRKNLISTSEYHKYL